MGRRGSRYESSMNGDKASNGAACTHLKTHLPLGPDMYYKNVNFTVKIFPILSLLN